MHEGSLEKAGEKYKDCQSEQLSNLITKYGDQLREIRQDILGDQVDWSKKFTESTYEFAVESAKKGESVILDLVPILSEERADYDIATELKKYAKDQGFSGEIIAVNANCDLGKITEHMDQRNAGKDPTQIRRNFRPFLQYAEMHQIAKAGNQISGQFTLDELNAAALKYGVGQDDVDATLEKLGASNSDQTFSVTPKSPEIYDMFCITDSSEPSKSKTPSQNAAAIDALVDSRTSRSLHKKSDQQLRAEMTAKEAEGEPKAKSWTERVLQSRAKSPDNSEYLTP